MNPLAQTTAIIKTFQRPDDLDRLIRSIRRFYPELRILVGDDGFKPSSRDDVEYLRLPPDIGLSAGRNAMLRHVTTPYFVLLEDDFEFSRRTKIKKLVALVEASKLDIAAGNCFKVQKRRIFFRKRQRPYHGLFRFHGDELQLIYGHHERCKGYLLCDITYNFFAARTDAILAMGGWDPELILNEHEEFFVRAQRHGLRVGYCSDVIIRHWNSRPVGYEAYRYRRFHHLAARKIGVRRVIDFHGYAYVNDRPPVEPADSPALLPAA